jgi:hypothetical protein
MKWPWSTDHEMTIKCPSKRIKWSSNHCQEYPPTWVCLNTWKQTQLPNGWSLFFFFSEMGRTWGIQTCIKLSIVVHSIQASHPNHGGHSGHRATGWTAGPRQAGLERLNEWLELANERRCLDNKHIFSGPSLKAMERERERYIYIYYTYYSYFYCYYNYGYLFSFFST